MSTPSIGCSVMVKTRQEIESVEPTIPPLQEEVVESKAGGESEKVSALKEELKEENGGSELSESEAEELDREAASYHEWNLKVSGKRRGRKKDWMRDVDRGSENVDRGSENRVSWVNWQAILREAIDHQDYDFLNTMSEIQAFPVVYTTNNQGNIDATYASVDWKLLTQLWNTINEFSLHGEPAKQVLDYIWEVMLVEAVKELGKELVQAQQQAFGPV